ncbi:MAG: hypothetical protein GY751_26315 [Bacteroidetes bacterium]|nr:hypothetical protein [Bacteroidota bacterium]
MSHDIEIEDVEDALKRAGEYAKLTGRLKKDIVADLLHDGQLNYSAGSDSKNLLDRAQEQAKKLQGLLTTLVPIVALLLSIGAEGFGIVDLTGWDFIGDEDDDGPIFGCMDDNAINYEEEATRDDESCEYPPPPEPDGPGCEPHLYDVQFLYTDSNNDTVKARFDIDCTNSGVMERVTVFFSAWMPNTTPDTGDDPVNHTTVWAEVEGTTTDYYSVSLGNFEAGMYDLYFILYDANGTAVDGAGEESRWIENPGELAERENERCDVVIESTAWDYTHNTTSLLYDLDCLFTAPGENEEGFYVSVQLGIWENGSDGVGEGNYSQHDTDHYFVEGDEDDPRDLYLNDIPEGVYDLFFIVIWEDENEELFNLVEHKYAVEFSNG